MFKSAMTACLWAMVFFGCGAQVWSDDMEDHFIDPDFNSSKSIFIDVKDASLINVLKIFSQQSGLSFIAQEDVAYKKITLYLNKIPINQALQMVLDANGLTYEMQNGSNVFVVKAKEQTAKNMITKVYQLKYATVSSSLLNSTISLSSAASSSGGSAASGALSGGLEQVIKDSLSPDGKVVEDTRTNSLIITDVPAQFEIIDSTIAKLDVPIPQVLIEVEMMEISKSTGDTLGISYGTGTTFQPLNFVGGSKLENWPFGSGVGALSGANASSSSSSSSSSASSTTTTGWNANGLTATLNFIANTTDSRILARPKILTLNNQTAQIKISTDQAISLETTSTSTGSSSSTLNAVTPERYTTGVILKVTPQANLITREITMAVSPQVIDVLPSTIQSAGQTIYDPTTRESDSILKLKDGQSMVIGGLMTRSTSNNVSKLPFLGDLPVIGSAFRNTTKQKNDIELVIFLTPHIIDDTNQAPLKDSNTSTAEEALDMQDNANRSQEVNDSLNSYEMKKY